MGADFSFYVKFIATCTPTFGVFYFSFRQCDEGQIENTFWNFPIFKAESKKLESLNRHLLTEKDEQQELVEFVQIEKEEFAKDLQSLKVSDLFRKI